MNMSTGRGAEPAVGLALRAPAITHFFRTVRSCSRTTAIRFNIAHGSSRSSEQPRADFTKAFVVGDEPTPRQVELYDICMGALAAGEALLRSDVPAAQVDAAVRGHFALHGLEQHFTSHNRA